MSDISPRRGTPEPARLALWAIVWAIMLICAGAPLAWLAVQLALHPRWFMEGAFEPHRLALLARTLLYNGAAAIVATALAMPVAHVLGRGRGMVATALWFALPVSLLIPSVTFTYGWSQCVRLLHVHGILRAYPQPAGAWDVARCVWSLATWLWPIPAVLVAWALRRLDPHVREQAMLDGADGRVTLRLLAGPILAGAAVAGALAVQEFGVYEPTGISVVATEVRMVFETGAYASGDNPMVAPMSGGAALASLPDQRARAAAAAATALPLLLVVALLVIPALCALRGAGDAHDALDLPVFSPALAPSILTTVAAMAVVVVALVIPLASLLLSLSRPFEPIRVWREFAPQITGSCAIALASGCVAIILALAGSAQRSRLLLLLGFATFLVGGQLLAIALIRIYNRPWLAGWVYNAPPIIIAAYLARFGWVVLATAAITWTRPWRAIRDVASADGATPLQSARDIVWPLAWPILLAGGLLVAALSLGEVPATVLLSPQRPPMLTPLLMTWVHMLRYDALIEGSLLLASMVMAVGILAAMLIRAGRRAVQPVTARVSAGLIVLLAMLWMQGCSDRARPEAIWCETGTGPAQVIYPRAISYEPADDAFVIIDRMARVQRLDREGHVLTEWRMPEHQTGKPVGVSVGPDGNVYVPDTHYHRVIVYSPEGKLLRQWGGFGTGPGQFIYPTDVAFDAAGRIFVSEYGDNDRIQVFDRDGKLLFTFGSFGSGDGQFSRPQSMVIDGRLVYVTDECNHRIAVFTTDGAFVRNMGRLGSGPGEFRFPKGLDLDARGRLVVCEMGNNRVQLIDKRTGAGLAIWGAGGREPGELAYPWGVAVDHDGRIVVVDAGNNRLQVFEF